MADQSKDPSGNPLAGDGSPQDPAGLGQAGENQETDGKGPMTLADGAQLEARMKSMLATQYQGVQSLIDRQSGNLTAALKPVNSLIESLRAQGVDISDEQAALERTKALDGVLASGGEPDGDPNQPRLGPDGQPQPDGRQTAGTLGDLALAMMRERGVVILQNDTELELIDQKTNDPQVFMASVDTAIKTKIQRLANPDDAGTGENGTDETLQAGPGINPRGKGKPNPKILSEKTPAGVQTTPQNFLEAGYDEADAFPSGG